LTSNVKEDVAIEEVIALAREVNRQATDHCFEYTLAMRAERARVELLRPESEELRKLLIEELAPEHVGHKDHSEGARTQQAVRCLQLLYLYRELAGDHLYVFSPPNTSSRACRLVATAWSREELEEDILKLLVTRYTDLSAVVNEVLSQTLPKVDDTSFQNKLKILKALTGEGVCATFMTKMDSFRSFADESARDTFWHLPEYLVLCERLAMRAVHEGESLSFRLFIGHGNVASQRLKFISRILTTDNKSVLDRSALHWAVNKPEDVESFSEAGLTSPCVLSLLLGNHSFLQDEEQRCVIHASPTGDLLNLCHLIGSTDPADVTDGGECILIMVEKNGDIKVFHPDRTSGSDLGRGRLLLWRRGGKWIVPEKYGHEYTDALTSAILTILGYSSADVQTHSALNVLTETAWNLSTHLKGASFVVIDSRRFSEEATPWQDTFAPMTQVFPFAEGRKLLTKTGSETLRQLAIQDGATIVDLADQRVFGRRHILVNYNVRDWLLKKVGESRARQETAGFLDTQGHHRILAWGTRHQSALAAALYLGADPDHNGCAKGNGCAGVVITVSSDGDIHVFGPDGMIPELAYPHAAQSNGKK
ncbi:MAG: hypothetical protein K9L89_04625, partial [Kiritimatiellales bacterium]|nr:hypothetical protein [Kiritimatiellales bacterium]